MRFMQDNSKQVFSDSLLSVDHSFRGSEWIANWCLTGNHVQQPLHHSALREKWVNALCIHSSLIVWLQTREAKQVALRRSTQDHWKVPKVRAEGHWIQRIHLKMSNWFRLTVIISGWGSVPSANKGSNAQQTSAIHFKSLCAGPAEVLSAYSDCLSI